MRRLLIIICLAALVLCSLGLGVLAADWPFWQRAWRWQSAGNGWPDQMPGVWRGLGEGSGQPMAQADAAAAQALARAMAPLAARWPTQALLVARAGTLYSEYYAAGATASSLLQGRSLTAIVLPPLYGIARAQGAADLLDQPLRTELEEWRSDSRGEITPRQLFWELSGLAAPAFHPWNPFSDRARLASGPNFERAALGFRSVYPPGSHYEPSPVNAQLLGMVLRRTRGLPVADQLQEGLWKPLGAGHAQMMVDRLGGEVAVHCCLAATGRDWLRLALLLADDGVVGGHRLLPAGFVQEMARAAPVHPGRGLGVSVGVTDSGQRLMWIHGAGRLLLAVPDLRWAAVWFAPDELPDAARGELLAVLGLHQSPGDAQAAPVP